MFEMGELMRMGEEAVVPALDYLFHRIEERFDGRPTLLILDEAWLFLRHPIFVQPAAGLAQDAAQEERLRRLRDPGGRRRREQPDRPDHPPGLPDEDLPARRAGADAGARDGLSVFGLTETEIAILARATEEARLLLQVRQGPAPVPARPRARHARLRRHVEPRRPALPRRARSGRTPPADARAEDPRPPPARVGAYRFSQQARATRAGGQPLIS